MTEDRQSHIAHRVAVRWLRAGVDLGQAFQEGKERALKQVASGLIREWSQKIERAFSSKFPDWQIEVEMELVEGTSGEDDEIRVSFKLSPSPKHPDKDWLDALDPGIGKEMDQWFAKEFMVYPSFWDASHDMKRRRSEFPIYNGSGVTLYW
jgi:hypothetical protein